MKIVFIHAGIEFDGDSLDRGPLGGTETALIGVSRELAKDPENSVCVFTNTPQSKIYSGVNYFPLKALGSYCAEHEIDVLISIRQWIPFWLPIRAKMRVYFSPDAYDQPFLHSAVSFQVKTDKGEFRVPLYEPHRFFDSIDLFFCVGEWQAKTFVQNLRFPEDKMFVSGNGVMLENFKPLELSQRRQHLMYSATPFRGLEHLIQYYSDIKTEFHDLKLEVCSGMGVYGFSKEQDQNEYADLYKRLASVGAISHGSIQQRQLAEIMCRNLIYTYPNTFEETFCISVLEAQAAGLPVVTSDRGALSERIQHGVDGFLIPGHPREESYKREFIATVQSLLTDQNLWQRISSEAIQTALSQTYENIAQKWMVEFKRHISTVKQAKMADIPALKEELITLQAPTSANFDVKIEPQKGILNQCFRGFGF